MSTITRLSAETGGVFDSWTDDATALSSGLVSALSLLALPWKRSSPVRRSLNAKLFVTLAPGSSVPMLQTARCPRKFTHSELCASVTSSRITSPM